MPKVFLSSDALGHLADLFRARCDSALTRPGLREKKTEVARTQLKELVAEFPENPLFASELAKLKVSRAAAIPPQ
jgi:hypothetical protein